MEKVYGRIEEKKEQEGAKDGKAWKRFSFKLDGKWYSTFDIALSEFEQGNNVCIEYEQSGKFLNIRDINNHEGPSPVTEERIGEDPKRIDMQKVWKEKDLRIVRQSCLRYANAMMKNMIAINPEGVKSAIKTVSLTEFTKSLANELVNFVYRDMEV